MRIRRHFANLFGSLGASAVCFDLPHRIDMAIESWTTSENAVTCKKCLKKLKENASEN